MSFPKRFERRLGTPRSKGFFGTRLSVHLSPINHDQLCYAIPSSGTRNTAIGEGDRGEHVFCSVLQFHVKSEFLSSLSVKVA